MSKHFLILQTLFVFQVVKTTNRWWQFVVAKSIEEAWSRGGGERGDKQGGVCLFVLCAGSYVSNSKLVGRAEFIPHRDH